MDICFALLTRFIVSTFFVNDKLTHFEDITLRAGEKIKKYIRCYEYWFKSRLYFESLYFEVRI